MRIALTLPSLPLSGVGTSVDIMRTGLSSAGHDVDVVVTGPRTGDDFERAKADGWDLSAINTGVRFLKRRLERTIAALRRYDAIINNTSPEAQLVFPCLPADTIRITVMRVLNEQALALTGIHSSWVDGTVAISKEMVRALEATPAIKAPIHLIQNSTRASNDQFVEPGSPVHIAYVGRVSVPDKNVLMLPRIADALHGTGLDFTLTVLGDGPALPALRDDAGESAAAGRIAFRGSGTRLEALDLLKKSHFVLMPSIHEGLSNVMLEAMAVGCVPITSDIDDFAWVLGDVSHRLQCRLNAPEDYARKLVSLVNACDLYGDVRRHLRNRQQTLFSPEVTTHKYLELLSHLEKHHDAAAFPAQPLSGLRLPAPYNRQCHSWWQYLQMIRDRIRKARRP